MGGIGKEAPSVFGSLWRGMDNVLGAGDCSEHWASEDVPFPACVAAASKPVSPAWRRGCLVRRPQLSRQSFLVQAFKSRLIETLARWRLKLQLIAVAMGPMSRAGMATNSSCSISSPPA